MDLVQCFPIWLHLSACRCWYPLSITRFHVSLFTLAQLVDRHQQIQVRSHSTTTIYLFDTRQAMMFVSHDRWMKIQWYVPLPLKQPFQLPQTAFGSPDISARSIASTTISMLSCTIHQDGRLFNADLPFDPSPPTSSMVVSLILMFSGRVSFRPFLPVPSCVCRCINHRLGSAFSGIRPLVHQGLLPTHQQFWVQGGHSRSIALGRASTLLSPHDTVQWHCSGVVHKPNRIHEVDVTSVDHYRILPTHLLSTSRTVPAISQGSQIFYRLPVRARQTVTDSRPCTQRSSNGSASYIAPQR